MKKSSIKKKKSTLKLILVVLFINNFFIFLLLFLFQNELTRLISSANNEDYYDTTLKISNKDKDRFKDYYSFDYPNNWTGKIFQSPAGYTVQPFQDLILFSPDYEEDKNDFIHIVKGASIFIRMDYVSENTAEEKFNKNIKAKNVAKSVRKIEINGIDGLQYDYEINGDYATNTTFVNNGIWYLIKFAYSNEDAKQRYDGINNKIIKTFLIKN